MLESLMYIGVGMLIAAALIALIAFSGAVTVVDGQEAWVIDSRLGIGKYKDRVLKEGWHTILPFFDKVVGKINLREQASDPEEQTIITEDRISIQVDIKAMIQIVDPWKAIMEVKNYEAEMESLIRDSVGAILARKKLTEIQQNLTNIAEESIDYIHKKSLMWGIKVTQVRFENIKYSDDIQKSMEKVTIAENEKKAMLSLADGKKEAAQREAEALLHKISILQKNMPDMKHEKILEFLKSMDYINSVQNLSASNNAKLILYPSNENQSIDKIIGGEYLSKNMDKKS